MIRKWVETEAWSRIGEALPFLTTCPWCPCDSPQRVRDFSCRFLLWLAPVFGRERHCVYILPLCLLWWEGEIEQGAPMLVICLKRRGKQLWPHVGHCDLMLMLPSCSRHWPMCPMYPNIGTFSLPRRRLAGVPIFIREVPITPWIRWRFSCMSLPYSHNSSTSSQAVASVHWRFIRWEVWLPWAVSICPPATCQSLR